MSPITIAQILSDTTACGFKFVTENVEKNKIEMKGAQIPIVTDLEKFVATFGPSLVLAALDGSSLRVSAQRINRDALWGKRDTPANELQEAVVAWMLGAKRTRTVSVVEVQVFLDIEGGKHETAEAAKAASLALLAAQQ